MENLTDDDLEKTESDGSDSDSNDDDHESNKGLIVSVNRTLLGFYLCQSVYLA